MACTGSTPTWNASADMASIRDCIEACSNGDTINIAAGTISWTEPLLPYCGNADATFRNLSELCVDKVSGTPGVTKYFTLMGAPCTMDADDVPTFCPTVIVDNIPRPGPYSGYEMWRWKLAENGVTRISNIEFQMGPSFSAAPQIGFFGQVRASNGAEFRLDHSRFPQGSSGRPDIFFGGFGGTDSGWGYIGDHLNGVFDHNWVDISNSSPVLFNRGTHSSMNGIGAFGNNSWAQPDTVGTRDALFFENNKIVNSGAAPLHFGLDGWWGGRDVWRYNKMCATYAGHHGTDSAGSGRSNRQTEFYENDVTGPDCASAWNPGTLLNSPFSSRGGVTISFNNRLSVNPSFTPISMFEFSYYRTQGPGNGDFPYTPWGRCGQQTITSLTGDGTTATATISGLGYNVGNFNQIKIQVTGASNANFNFVGNMASAPDANTFTYTCSAACSGSATGAKLQAPWDGNSASSGYRCLDQAGAGYGDLIDSSNVLVTFINTVSGIPSNANQVYQPSYVWNNRANGNLMGVVADSPQTVGSIGSGADIINCGTTNCRPGYTPYTYPHPLVGGADLTPPAAPTGLRRVQ